MTVKKHLHPTAVLVLMSILWAQMVNAQTYELSHHVIGVTGNGAKAGALQFSMTVGEPAIQTLRGETYILTQGFHQPAHFLFTGVDNEKLLAEWGLKLYPNPTAAILQLSTDANRPAASFRLVIVNADGKVVLPPQTWSGSPFQTLDCTALSAGAYFLQVIDPAAGRRITLPFIKVEN